ncbi:MAG TPA: hypothetical protein VG935_03825, partial [Patescibacteria group bacterium]|nr:hypothetical protein [Patescibacteria group bacterium]
MKKTILHSVIFFCVSVIFLIAAKNVHAQYNACGLEDPSLGEVYYNGVYVYCCAVPYVPTDCTGRGCYNCPSGGGGPSDGSYDGSYDGTYDGTYDGSYVPNLDVYN